MRNYLKLGLWNVICDRCGFQYKNNQLKKEWTGLMVCNSCWEPRHPQDLLRVPEEKISVPWSRPEGHDNEAATDAIQTEPVVMDILTDYPLPILVERNDGFIVTEAGNNITTENGAAPLQTEH